MLKMTRIELELISDPEIHDFVDRGLRGGVSVITKRYVEGAALSYTVDDNWGVS